MSKARSVSKRQEGLIGPPNKEQPKPVPFLTGIQERMADIVGELIVSGGTHRNLDLLCRIAADHEARRAFSPFHNAERAQLEKGISERSARSAFQWYDALAEARANREKLPEEIRPESTAVTDLIRVQKREEVDGYFGRFLAGALPEEIHLMWHIMLDWESQHSSVGDGFESLYIANGFELQIGLRREYVRVPPHLTEDVEAYVRALLKAQPAKEVV